jgi:septal ring factor EnvC (AmiA/AmiB activator)
MESDAASASGHIFQCTHFLKEHKKVEQLQATVAQQQKGFEAKLAKQEEQIERLTAGLQKVSAQLELSNPAPQTVLNNN